MQDNFTRIPNSVIDNAKLNPYQFQLFSIIVRKTDGWCKVEDGISLSQFEKMVTFKKPKIISTLKELIELGFIEKKYQSNSNGGNSYNSYKISHTLVTENNKGSNSGLQGVVTEDYTQKKANTKETITSKKNTKKDLVPLRELNYYPNINIKAFNEWMDYKKYKNKGAVSKTLNMLNKYSFEVQQDMVDKSIMNEYKGLFEPKQQQPRQSFQQQDRQQRDESIEMGLKYDVFELMEMQEQQKQDEAQGLIDGKYD